MGALMLAAVAWASIVAGEPEPLVVGYLPNYRAGAVSKIRFERLTDVVYFSAEPTADGGLDTERVDPAALAALKERAAAAGTRVHLAVGGWDRSDGFAPMAADPAKRRQFVETLRDFLVESELDGADFDWEFPADEKQKADYAALLTEAGTVLGRAGLACSVAVPGNWAPFDGHPVGSVDRIHVMSYDSGTPHSTIEQMQRDAAFWRAQGWGDAQIVIGVPFYGRNVQRDAKAYADLLAIDDPGPDVDEIDGYHFNNRTTTGEKAAWVLGEGLGGVMIWELGQDSFDERSLLGIIAREAERVQPERAEPRP